MFIRRNTIILLAVAALTAVQAGCVQRRITVRSNPPGALVYIDDQEIGHTPVSTAFTAYGTRKFQLIMDGHETITVYQKFNPPWYEIPPLDFFSENFGMTNRRDERVVDFQLVPQQIVPTDKLRERAEQMRQGVRQGAVVPMINPRTP